MLQASVFERFALDALALCADCGWTPIRGSVDVFTRKNGRADRLSPARDWRHDMFRIDSAEDAGKRVGTDRMRGDASKALTQLDYQCGVAPRQGSTDAATGGLSAQSGQTLLQASPPGG